MLDHICLNVGDYEKSKAFYAKALVSVGYSLLMEPVDGIAGFGLKGKPYFWVIGGQAPQTGVHVAFVAPDRKAVDAFYRDAIAAGAKDNGKPGVRKLYHPDYYGAFVFDPDGNNIEAVCHKPE